MTNLSSELCGGMACACFKAELKVMLMPAEHVGGLFEQLTYDVYADMHRHAGSSFVYTPLRGQMPALLMPGPETSPFCLLADVQWKLAGL